MSSLTRRPLLPSRLRFTLCLMAGAYPLITAILVLLAPVTSAWPLPLRTLVIVPLMVSGMVFAIIPLVQRLAGGWIAAGVVRTESA
jgi:antibiotic biosynthesis monooxygenase (ABM) superfamily enzyme